MKEGGRGQIDPSLQKIPSKCPALLGLNNKNTAPSKVTTLHFETKIAMISLILHWKHILIFHIPILISYSTNKEHFLCSKKTDKRSGKNNLLIHCFIVLFGC